MPKPDAPKQQLYDLNKDLTQKINVIRQHPQVAAAMRAELARIRKHPTAPHARSE